MQHNHANKKSPTKHPKHSNEIKNRCLQSNHDKFHSLLHTRHPHKATCSIGRVQKSYMDIKKQSTIQLQNNQQRNCPTTLSTKSRKHSNLSPTSENLIKYLAEDSTYYRRSK